MTNKQKKEKIEQINEKFRSLLEPYADQLRNTGLIVEWFPEEDYPDCSSFSCCLSKNDLDEGDEFIGIYINAPEMDIDHPERYNFKKYIPEIYFTVENKIREKLFVQEEQTEEKVEEPTKKSKVTADNETAK